MGQYDQFVNRLAAEGGTPTNANTYDNTIEQLKQQSTGRAATLVGLSVDANADRAATSRVLARRFNTSPDVVDKYPDEFRQRMAIESARDILSQSPRLRDHLNEDPDLARVLHPELAQVAQIEQMTHGTEMRPWNPSYGQRLTAWWENLFGIPERRRAEAMNEYAAESAGMTLGQARTAVGGMNESVEQAGSKFLNVGSFGILPDVAGEAQTTSGAVGAAGGGLAGFLVGPVKGAGALLSGRLGKAVTFEAQAGDSFSKALAKTVANGAVHLGIASELSSLVPAINSSDIGAAAERIATETGHGALMGALFGGLGRALPDNTIPQTLARIVGANVGVDALSGTSPAETYANWDKLTEPQKAEVLTNYVMNSFFALHGAGRTQGGWFKDAAKADLATEDYQRLYTIGRVSAASKYREADPEGFKRLVERMTEDGDLENVYVDVNTFAQAMNDAGVTIEELQDKMPDVALQLMEAAQTDGLLRISTADYATHIAGGKMDAGILEHLKVDPDGKTYAEAKEFQQNHLDSLAEEAKALTEKQVERQKFESERKAIFDDVKAQLEATGRNTSAVNNQYAALHRDLATVLADRLGITPSEAYEKYGASIRATSGLGPQYDQNAAGGVLPDGRMGINVRSDTAGGVRYADELVDGRKTYETRDSDSLRPYVGRRVAIVRTGEGVAKAIGEVTLGEPIVVNEKEFRRMQAEHLVPEGSTFDVKPGGSKYLYPVSEPVRYDAEKDVGPGIVSRRVLNQPNIINFAAATRNRLRIPSEDDMRTWSREQLINWLQDMDPNGIYADPAPNPNFTLVQAEGQGNRWAVLDDSTGEYVDNKVYDTSGEAYAAWRDAAYADAELPPMTQEEALDAALQMRADAVAGSAGEVVQGEFNQSAVENLVMVAERGERVVGARSIISTQEKTAIKAASNEHRVSQKEIIATVREHKLAHPVEQGWAPLVFKRLVVDPSTKKVSYEYEAVPYEFSNGENGKQLNPGTPEYTLRQNAIAQAMVEEVRRIYRRAQAGDKNAKNILAQAGWYKAMRSRLRQEFGGLGDLFADLLGATSPNTPVRENWTNAVTSLKRAMRGDYDALMPKWTEWADKIDELELDLRGWFNERLAEGLSKKAIKDLPEYQAKMNALKEARKLDDSLLPLKESGKKYGFNGRNIVRGMVDLWRVVKNADADIGRGGTAPKALNFSGNLIGFRERATIDVWAARMLQRLAGSRRIPSMAETGVSGEMREDATTTLQFGFGQDVFGEATRRIQADSELQNEKVLAEINDDDLQAVVWFVEKELWTINNWTNAAGEGGSFELEANLTGSAEQDKIRDLRRIADSSRTKPKEKAEAKAALAALERTTDRFVGGLSTQMSAETQGVDYVPTDADMARLGHGVRLAIYETDNGATVLASKALSTEGRYGSIERSLDLEAVVREGYNPSPLWLKMLKEAQKAKQDSTFLARVLRDKENVDMLRHRPGVEIYFRETADRAKLEEMLAALKQENVEFLTVIVDGRRTPGAMEGEMGNAVGVRMLYIPEFEHRYGMDNFNGLDDLAIADKIRQKASELRAIAERVNADVEGVSFAGQFWYDTQVAFSSEYQEKIDALTTGTAEGSSSGVGGSQWAGQSIRKGIESADRQARETAGGEPDGQPGTPDAGDARPADQVLNQSGYHGSPHDFPAFSLDYIGTGEGEAAFGWGLYFASMQDVARAYGYGLTDINGGPVKMDRTSLIPRARYGSVQDGIENRTKELDRLKAEAAAGDEKAAAAARNLEQDIADMKARANLYSVEVPDDAIAKMLDWDRPLSEQTDAVKQAFSEVWNSASENERGSALLDYWGDYEAADEMLQDLGDPSGQLVYKLVASLLGDNQAASEHFAKFGVPGNKFLDKGSRGAGKGTQNYVLWDQGVIDEMNKTLGKFTQETPNGWDSIDTFDPASPDPLKPGAGSRGTYRPVDRLITLLPDADLSTFLHETGHYLLDVYMDIARQPDAPAEIREDMEKVLGWFGVESLDKWHSMTIDEQRAHHENFARGFEAYLFEGKAPNLEMRTMFQRFREWLKQVYQSVTELNVQLTPEVRQVMDRMLATDKAIKEAEAARVFEPLTEKPEGVSDADWKDYQDLHKEATEKGLEELLSRSLKDMKWLSGAKSKALRELQQQAANARKEVRQQVEDEVNAMPVYQAERWLSRGETFGEDGEQIKLEGNARLGAKLNTALVREMYPDSVLSKPDLNKLRSMMGPKGMDPQIAAEMFGFRTADELVRALAEREPRESVIEGMTDQRMLEEHGELATSDALERGAQAAVHNEARARFMATGLKMLTKGAIPARLLLKGAKEAAEGAVAQKRIRDLKPEQHEVAEGKANKSMLELAPKDPAGAVRAQRSALLNNQLAKATMQAMTDVAKGLEYLKKFAKDSVRENIDLAFRDQIDELLARYDLRTSLTPVQAQQKRMQSLAGFVEKISGLGFTPTVPERLLADVERTHYKDLTVEDFRGLMVAIKSLEKLGRDIQRVMDGEETRLLSEVAAEAKAQTETLPQRTTDTNRGLRGIEAKWLKAKAAGRSMAASLLKVEQMVDWLDDRNPLGIFNRMVFRKIADAEAARNDLDLKVSKQLGEYVATVSKDILANGRTIYEIPGIIDKLTGKQQQLTWSEKMALAGLRGDASAFGKLIKGEEWDVNAVLRFLDDNMSKAEWDFVRGLAEQFQEVYDLKKEMLRNLGDTAPKDVDRIPFPTPHGEMSGWYWPIKYDPARSYSVAERAARDVQSVLENNFFERVDTSTGREMTRNENYAKPMLLSLDTVPRVLKDEIRDVTTRKALLEVERFLAHPDVRDGVSKALSPEHYRAMREWLISLANDAHVDAKDLQFWDRIFHEIRTRTTMVGLGFRLTTMIMHGTTAAGESVAEAGFRSMGKGVFNKKTLAALTTIGPKWLQKGVDSFIRSDQFEANRDFIFERSAEMRHRANEFERDVREKLREIDLQMMDPATSGITRARLAIESRAYSGIGMLDMASALPTWMGSYLKALSPVEQGGLGYTEQDAVYFADKTLRNAHGGGGIKDMAAVQRGGETWKLFTMFYTFWNHNVNRLVDTGRRWKMLPRDYSKAKEQGNMAGFRGDVGNLVLRTFMYTLGVQYVHHMLHPPKDDEEPDTWLAWFGKQLTLSASGGVPLARDVAGHYFGGKDYELSPVASMVDNVDRLLGDMKDGSTHEKWVKHAMTVNGYLLGLPLGQIGNTAQFLSDVWTGEQDPQDMSDWWSGIVHGDMHH